MRKTHQISANPDCSCIRLLGVVVAFVVAIPLVLYWSQSGPDAASDNQSAQALTQARVVQAQFFWPFGNRRKRRIRRLRKRRTIRKDPAATAPPRQAVASGDLDGTAAEDKTATRIVVFGDSLAIGLWQGLANSIGTEDQFQVLKKTKTSSGLVRDDFYDWGKVVDKVLETERVDVAVWFVGVNDGQDMRTKEGKFAPRSPEWVERYRARIDRIVKAFQAKGAAVYWVGLPIMRSQRVSSNVAYFNELFRERMKLLGARYVDVWDGFADENGKYNAYGPDLAGEKRKLRRANGIHLTRRGNQKLAYFVSQAVRRDLKEFGTTLDGRQVIRQGTERGGLVVGANGRGLRISPNAILVGGDAAQNPEGERQRTAGLSASQRTASVTGQTGSTSKSGKSDGEDVVSPLFLVLMRGEALQAKTGRADDFSWPRP